jgi:hypothetical protein
MAMRYWFCGILLGLAGVVGSACTPQPSITPSEAVGMVRTGRPLLSCRESCLNEWRRVEPQAQQYAAAGRWDELAAAVLRVGYQDDLTEFYLARAAEGLGYPGAAAGYYRRSLDLSGTTIGCANLSRQCGGVALPRTALMRLAAIDQQLDRGPRRPRSPRRPEQGPGEPPAPPGPSDSAAPSELSPPPTDAAAPVPSPPAPAPSFAPPGPVFGPPAPSVAPSAQATAPAAPKPVPAGPRSPPPGSDYIEPPPLPR